MVGENVVDSYFDWICEIIDADLLKYGKLLHHLFRTEFLYTIAMDCNRYDDGLNLRPRFAYENGYDVQCVTDWFEDRPCSMLEMMSALALRAEEHIMIDPEVGLQSGRWFWAMIDSLGLTGMTNQNFDERVVDDVLDRLYRHKYASNGRGGLFTIHDPNRNMRNSEIWYQMMWYLNEVTNL